MRNILTIFLLLFSCSLFAQKEKTVEAEFTYYAPENESPSQAKQAALKHAQIKAIASEFGTIVSQSNITRMENKGGESTDYFLSIGSADVKGEWIETIGKPVYNITYDDGILVVNVKVKGRIREIVRSAIDFQAHILRNGTDDKFEDDTFGDGDDLYLSFVSPTKGFLAVYLVDENSEVYCLFPYRDQEDGIYPIRANKRYVFFNRDIAPQQERQIVDEYEMRCDEGIEHNQIYVIFSPNEFAKAADATTSEGLPRHLTYQDFNRWLAKCRKHDVEMTPRMFNLTLKR